MPKVLALCAGFSLPSCHGPLAQAHADAGAPVCDPSDGGCALDGGADVLAASIDAGPPPLPGATLIVVPDAGPTEDAAPPDDLTLPDASVPDSAAIRFTADVALDDVRARILTDDDRFVPNHAELLSLDGGIQITLSPQPFWPARGCCRFVLDGDAQKLPGAAEARFQPFSVHMAIAAEPGRAQAAQGTSQRQKRRRHRR